MKNPFQSLLNFNVLLIMLFLACPAIAAEGEPAAVEPGDEEWATELFKGTTPQPGPFAASLGGQGRINVPEGYVFFNAKDSRTLLQRMENETDGSEMGMISPDDFNWFVVFEFENVGYVTDSGDDADIDAKELLASYRRGVEQSNKEADAKGWSKTELLGWSVLPHYNRETKNLEWGLKFSSDDGADYENYNVRLLGREGVMKVVLVGDSEGYDGAMKDARALLEGFTFTQGKTYAEFRQGDKLAGYGVAALIGGGALAVAAKSGFLTKFFKPILAGVAVVGAFILNLFRRKKKGPLEK